MFTTFDSIFVLCSQPFLRPPQGPHLHSFTSNQCRDRLPSPRTFRLHLQCFVWFRPYRHCRHINAYFCASEADSWHCFKFTCFSSKGKETEKGREEGRRKGKIKARGRRRGWGWGLTWNSMTTSNNDDNNNNETAASIPPPATIAAPSTSSLTPISAALSL